MLLGVLFALTYCNHVWIDATCTEPKTCEKCGRTRGDPIAHSWIDASCTHPQVCRYCIRSQGEPLEHEWLPATCTKPEACKHCNATRGESIAHRFAASADGKTKICVSCGKNVTIKYVALTFDDGPSGDNTKELVKGLNDRNAKATFFLCGYRIALYPDQPELIASYGHEVALHTENHSYLTKLSSSNVRNELQDELNRIPSDINVRLMRPPGGLCDGTVQSICRNMGLSIIMWNLDTEDWTYDEADYIVDAITCAEPGDVILMHDIKSSSMEAALQAIDIMTAQGYEFVTVSRLAEIQGYSLTPGEIYYYFP